MSPSGIETTTFRLEAQCLIKLHQACDLVLLVVNKKKSKSADKDRLSSSCEPCLADRSARGTEGTSNTFPICLSRTIAKGSFESVLLDSYSDSKSSGIESWGRLGTTLASHSGGLRFKRRGNRLSQVRQGVATDRPCNNDP